MTTVKDLKERVTTLEHEIEVLKAAREEDRKTILNLITKCGKVIGQTNDRLDKHFDDMMNLSDRVNLAEGMIDILKKDVSQVLFKEIEEESDLDEHETS